MQIGGDIDGEAANDQSGKSVSLSSDGRRLAIGATHNDGSASNAGHVRIYQLNGSDQWVQVGGDINGEAAEDLSGYFISLSKDGNTVAIGAPANDGNGTSSGQVRVYALPSGSLQNPNVVASLTDGVGGWNYLKYPRDITTAFIDETPYAFVATPGDMSVQIIDLSDPSSPQCGGYL